MNRRDTMLFPALLLAAAACSGSETSLLGSDVTDPTALTSRFATAGSVKLSPDSSSLETGRTLKLEAVVLNREGRLASSLSAVAMRWASSDTTIAKVSGSGVVVAIKPGTVTIRAFAGTQAGSSTVAVHAPGQAAPAATAPSEPSSSSTPTNTTTTAPQTGTSTTSSTSSTTPTSAPAAPSSGHVITATGPGLSGKAILSDDFSHYATTADLENQISTNIGGTGDWRTALYRDGRNAQLASIDPTVQYNGHATMKYTQPGGTGSTPELWVPLPAAVSTMWLRAKIRFGPGFTTTGTLTNSANAYKLLGWNLAGVDGSGRLEITNTNQYDLYWGAALKGVTAVPNSDAGGGPLVSTEWQDGVWYDYIIEYSVTSATTGVARAWLTRDGQTPKLIMTRYRTANSGYTMPLSNGICLGLNFNQQRTATQNQALWYGQWEIVDGSAHPDPFGVNGGQN